MFSSYLKRKRYTPASDKINKTGESFLTKKTDTPSLYSLPKSLDNNKNTLKLPSYSEISSSLAKSSADFSQ